MRTGDNKRQTEKCLQATGYDRGKNLNLISMLCRYILASSQNKSFP